jgi:hypothetical protein
LDFRSTPSLLKYGFVQEDKLLNRGDPPERFPSRRENPKGNRRSPTPLRFGRKNISRKGPRNCRSLGFARDDKGEGDSVWRVVKKERRFSRLRGHVFRSPDYLWFSHHFPCDRHPLLCHPERSRGICSSADSSWICFSTKRRVISVVPADLGPGRSQSETPTVNPRVALPSAPRSSHSELENSRTQGQPSLR